MGFSRWTANRDWRIRMQSWKKMGKKKRERERGKKDGQ
jgi:hypothetical protein